MTILTAIIVEDEPLSRMYLQSLLETWSSNVQVIANASSCDEAVKLINQHKPSIIFLDIELLNSNGLEVVKKLTTYHPEIIFTTAFGDQTLKIIKPSGMLFLQKPIDSDDLIKIIQKTSLLKNELHLEQMNQLLKTLENNNIPATVYIETNDEKSLFIPIADIVLIESNSTQSQFLISNGQSLRVTNLSLKDCESFLCEHTFCRVSQQHIINIDFVELFTDKEEPFVIMKNQTKIPVSLKRIDTLRNAMK